MKMKKNSMHYRAGAWYASGLASIIMMLIMMGTPAFAQYSLTNSSGPITINDESVIGTPAQASPYASTITVPASAFPGTLEKVTVTLNGLSHGYANDIVAILVGPNNTVVQLMGNVGGGQLASNVVLTFDDAATASLSQTAALTSGTFKPTNITPDDDGRSYGISTAFPAPAPQTLPYASTLAAAFPPGSTYAGAWTLYVIDTAQPNTGSISNWVLNLYTTPVVTGIQTNSSSGSPIVLNENTSSVLLFTNADSTSNATLTAVVNGLSISTDANNSGGTVVLTNGSSITFSPITPNGVSSVTFTPTPNTSGTANFSIVLKDAQGQSAASSTIFYSVTHVPQAPKLIVPSTITASNGVASFTNVLTMISQDGNGFGALSLKVTSTNLGNVGIGTTVFTNTFNGGTPVNNTISNSFAVVPNGFPVGTSYLNFILTDTATTPSPLSVTQTVAVVVAPVGVAGSVGPLVFTNTNSITLAADVSTPITLSSTITVPSLPGIGSNGTVSVSLLGLTSVTPNAFAAALVSPGGTVIPLLINPAGAGQVTNAEITFYDGTGATASVNTGNTLPNGAGAAGQLANVSITNYVEKSAGSTLAPAVSLNSIAGTTATNVWTLLLTNTSSSAISIAAGWVLDLYPAPLVTFTNPSLTTLDSTPGHTQSTNEQVVASSILQVVTNLNVAIPVGLADNNTAPTVATVTPVSTNNVGGTNFTTFNVVFNNNLNEFTTNGGAIPITLTAKDTNSLTGSATLPYIITFVDQTPTISFINEQVTFAGDAILNIPFVVGSADTNAARLNINVTSDNQALLPTTQVQNNAIVTRGPSTGNPVSLAAGDPPFQPLINGASSPSLETNYLSLYPVGIKPNQIAHVTVAVDDGTTTNSETFLLFVQSSGSPIYYNPSAINIPTQNTNGSPFPSTNIVSGLVGTVENVVVTLYDVNENNNAPGLNVLLVGPSAAAGKNPAVYLMGDAGQGTGLVSANLIFSNAIDGTIGASTVLPQASQISSTNIYYPTNYTLNGYTVQASGGSAGVPAPTANGSTGYGTNMIDFKGINPNGVWSLYVFDTNGQRGGAIFGGWTLQIFTAPNVSPATNVYTTLENVSTNILIPVGDAEPGNASLTVSAITSPAGSSSTTTISIANSNSVPITNNGTANQALLAITPNPFQFGTNNILITATDSSGVVSTTNITFIVASNSQPPQILITNTAFSTPAAVPISGITFAVWDPQTTNANTINVSATPSGLISSITVSTNDLNGGNSLDKSGTNSYQLAITPSGVQTGTATITIAVTDGLGQTAKTNLTLNVTSNSAFISTGSLQLGPGYPANSLGNPYPYQIPVFGVGGSVSEVSILLQGFSHNDASDVAFLLVSPDGQHSVILMAGAGDQLAANNVNLTFSDTAGQAIPQNAQLSSGTFLPANYDGSSLVFSNPAPSSGYQENFGTAFNGVQPNGKWALYALDLAFPDSGSLQDAILFLTTKPAISAISPQGVAENGTLNVPLSVSDSSVNSLTNLTVTAVSSDPTHLVVTVQSNLVLGATNLLIAPSANYPSSAQSVNSTNSVTVTVSDGNVADNVSTTFTVIITNINQAPVITAVQTNGVGTSNLQIAENGSATITFTVLDVDSSLAGTNINLVSTNPALVVTSGITTNSTIGNSQALNTPGTISYTIHPVANVFGTNIGGLVFTVSDTNNNTTTTNITLSISHSVQIPTVSGLFSGTYQLLPGTSSTNIKFSVTTFESNATLTVTAASSAAGSIPNSPNNIIITPNTFSNAAPGTYTGTIQLIVPSGATAGTATIYVTNTQVVSGTTNVESPIASFNVQILASPSQTFANSTPIGNTASKPVALPYPSPLVVGPGLVGGVASASVTLNSFSASDPADVTVVVEAPDGTSVLLLGGAGGTNAASNLTLTFADTNSLAGSNTALAANGASASYHPTGYVGASTPLPTNGVVTPTDPAPPYFDRMAVFNGHNPNGTWNLWVIDNTTGQTVSIANGWSLTLATAPLLSFDSGTPASLTIPENAPGQQNLGSVSFNIVDSTGGASGDAISITTVPTNLFSSIQLVGPATNHSNPVDYTATFTPAALVSGSGTISFTVTRTTDGAADTVTLPVSIVKSNMAPVLTRLGAITANENQTAQTEFFVTEIGDPLSAVTVTATSSNPNLIRNTNITFTTGFTSVNPAPGVTFPTNMLNLGNISSSVPNAADLILNLTPNNGAVSSVVGSSTITVTATSVDSAFNSPQTTTATFNFTVNAAQFAPTFSGIPANPVSVIAGNTAVVSFQVNSADATPPEVTVTAQNLSAPNGVTVGAITNTGVNLTILTPSNAAGSTFFIPLNTSQSGVQIKSTIQVTATDANNLTTTTNFQLVVVPNQQHFFSNATPISIVDVSPANPSPSTINVSGLVGLVSQVIVTANGFSHQYPADVGMLLVGPNGSNTVLMNNAGTGFPVSGLNLTFSDGPNQLPTGPAPASQPLSTATYFPSDYQPVKPYNFETSGPNNTTPPNPPPPSGPYATNLNVFNNSNPNGNWNLYVQDDSAGDVGNITGGWTIEIFTQPLLQITGLTNISVTEANPTGKTAFVILDDSPVGAINYTSNSFGVTSTNAALIPPANVTFSGSGTNWTANFTGALNVTGSSLITIFSTNSYNQVASNSFLVTVTAVNFPPTVFLPTPGSTITIQAGTSTTIPLGYSDTGFNTNTLLVSATSSNLSAANPIPNGSLSFVGNGTGPSNLVVTPVGTVTGSNLITVTVTQPVSTNASSGSVQFTVVVVPSTQPVFANTGAITIGTNSPAVPYPSTITVSGIGSPITNVTATLVGFSHTFPADVSALLVGPGGQAVMLMSDEGGGIGVNNLRLTFADNTSAMSANGPITSGTYAPSLSDLNFINNNPDVILPNAPSNNPPATRYLHTLASFNGAQANGTWSLYVYDNAFPDTGVIAGGWQLNFQTVGPEVTPLAPVTLPENGSTNIAFSVGSATTRGSNITVAVSSANQSPAGLLATLSAAVVPGTGNSNYVLTIIPTTNYPSAVTNTNGTATITVTLSDTNGNISSNSFPLTVLYSNIPPTVVFPISSTNTPANVPVSLGFTVSDVQTTNITLTTSLTPASSTNIGAAAITTNADGSFTLTFTPNLSGSKGLVTVNVVANNGVSSTTNSVAINVTAGLAPVVTVVSATNVPENGTITIPFTVANVGNLTNFTAQSIVALSSATNLVTSVGVTGSGTNYTATVTPNAFKTGNTVITFFTQDQFGIGSATTTLTVTPVEYPPTLGPIADTNTTANTPVKVTLNVTDVATSITNLTYSANISSTNVIRSVTFSYNGSNEVATINPATNKAGAAAITIIVSDGVTNVSQTFAISVTAPTPPVIGPISSQTSTLNTPLNVTLPVISPVTAISNLTFTGSSSNAALIKSISFSFNGSNEVATITPQTNAQGSATVTVTATDPFSQSSSQTFNVTINPPTPPTLGPISAQSTTANTPATVTLNVTSPATPITNLTFSGVSTNTNLVKSITFAFNGSNEVAIVTPVTNATGVGSVTVSVSDGFSTNSQSFTLTVSSPTPPTLTTAVSNGVLKITFTGTPGVTYRIQSSTDLKTWTTVASVTANATTGAAEYDTPLTSAAGVTAFRAVTP